MARQHYETKYLTLYDGSVSWRVVAKESGKVVREGIGQDEAQAREQSRAAIREAGRKRSEWRRKVLGMKR